MGKVKPKLRIVFGIWVHLQNARPKISRRHQATGSSDNWSALNSLLMSSIIR